MRSAGAALAALVAVWLVVMAAGPAAARQVVDLAGRTVVVPDRIERVACLEVLCYPRMLMLGAGGRVVMMVATTAPWMAAVDPAVGRIATFRGAASLEAVIAAHPDVVFLNPSVSGVSLDRLRAAGIPALVSQPVGTGRDADRFVTEARAMVRLFGAVLGGEAEARAEAWCADFDRRIALVRARVALVPPERRPRLYYVRGPGVLDTQGREGYTTWAGEIAGARMVVRDSALAAKGTVSVEDLVRWDPEVIVVGRQYPLALALADRRLAGVAAVRAGRVVASPAGVFYWDGGPEQVLLVQFLAKLLHPALFADIDMEAEVRDYYTRFYRHGLSRRDAVLLLEGRSPDGSRFNMTGQ